MTSQPTAADLEALLLDPNVDQRLRWVQAHAPAALLDQTDAATRDALAAMGDLLGSATGPRNINAANIPGWLRLSLLDAFVQWINGTGRTCPHNPDPFRPQPVMAAAWRPGLVVCLGCLHLLSLHHNHEADATCDGCGRRCVGVDQGEPIYPAVVQLGPLLFRFGTCVDCVPDGIRRTLGVDG